MKQIIAIITVVATCALAVVGCTENTKNTKTKERLNEWIYHGHECYTTVIFIEGHKYIIMDGYKCGNIVHAESCSCKQR